MSRGWRRLAGTTNGAMRKRRCTARCFRKARIRWASAAAITIFPVLAATLVGQSADLPAALNLEGLGKAAHSHMRTKLEKTIFKVDVLDVDVWFGQEDARHLGRLVNGRSYSDGLADSTSAVAIHSRDALVRILFLRDISLRQFLDGIDENMRHLPEEYQITQNVSNLKLGTTLSTGEGERFCVCWDDASYERKPGFYVSKCEVPGKLFSHGGFILGIISGMPGTEKTYRDFDLLRFYIDGGVEISQMGRSILRPDFEWQTECVSSDQTGLQ